MSIVHHLMVVSAGLCVHVLPFEALLAYVEAFLEEGHLFLLKFSLALIEASPRTRAHTTAHAARPEPTPRDPSPHRAHCSPAPLPRTPPSSCGRRCVRGRSGCPG